LKIFIKYMVSLRCKMVVKAALEEMNLLYRHLDLGEVELLQPISEDVRNQLKIILKKSALELMDDKKAILIERIKTMIIEMIHYSDDLPLMNNSDYLASKLGYNYTYLAELFAEVTGTTINHYIIAHKIERAKELLLYDELSLTEISFKLNYSSVAHLSNQFKKVTGLTPSYFKTLKRKRRTALEDL
jgi:AraC-like DNA-binding protein